MLAKVRSCAVLGLDAEEIEVEVDIAGGLERVTLVGLPDTAVRESSERVRAAIGNSGLFFPNHRLTINLAPADLRKEGPAYDLPIAVAILAATRQIQDALDDAWVLGELGLDGSVRHVNGVLPMANAAAQRSVRRLFVPAVDAPEAALVEGVAVYPVASLGDLAAHLNGALRLEPQPAPAVGEFEAEPAFPVDFQDVKGQEIAKRALEVACAGGHNVIMQGSPGAGKTLLARALPSILPKLSLAEALDVTRIYSVADALPPDAPLIRTRPFRSPHHTISHAGLVGGGAWPRPGEISLAHRGVLFLDELAEFGTRNLETLRQPLEDRVVTIARAQGSLTFPANFILIGATNPCPCGYYGDSEKQCSCTTAMVSKYQKRISGPILDRIDIHLDVQRVPIAKLASLDSGEPSRAIRARVQAARARQAARFASLGKPSLLVNGDMGPAEVQSFCRLDEQGRALMRAAAAQMGLSARGYHRVLKISRTIADLAGEECVQVTHLAEALQYRPRSTF
ncbi:MAG: YifB family Mg chelatase-like AAA ATPase [Caldilineaceae bacterium]|nr:YifB family Mg chelatase-like AAA ATPase [Caldilineaceae bacterium]